MRNGSRVSQIDQLSGFAELLSKPFLGGGAAENNWHSSEQVCERLVGDADCPVWWVRQLQSKPKIVSSREADHLIRVGRWVPNQPIGDPAFGRVALQLLPVSVRRDAPQVEFHRNLRSGPMAAIIASRPRLAPTVWLNQ